MSISECSVLEKVFAGEESDIEDGQAIILPNLKKLRLRELPNLINVCRGFKWHSVTYHDVTDCPKLNSTTKAPLEHFTKEYQNPVEEGNKESKRDKEHMKQEEVKVGNMNIIEQSTISWPMEDTSLSAITASGLEEAHAINQDQIKVPSQTALTHPTQSRDTDSQTSTNQDVNLSAPLAATNKEYQTSEEGGNQKKDDKNVIEQTTVSYPESKEAHRTHDGTALLESSQQTTPCTQSVPEDYNQNDDNGIKSEIFPITNGKARLQTQGLDAPINPIGTASEKYTVETSSHEFLTKAPKSDPISMDHQQEVFEENKGDLQSDLNLNKATNIEQKMPQISSLNKGHVYLSVKGTEETGEKDPTSKKPQLAISSLELVKKETECYSASMEQQLTPEENKASKKLQPIATTSQLSPISSPSPTSAPLTPPSLPNIQSPSIKFTSIPQTIEASTSSSAGQHTQAEDLVNFQGLFKIDARRASLLEEAFSKYPQLWEWQKRFRPKFRNWGYKSLADMLVFLTSETPQTIDHSRREEFEKLYNELEYFRFDKEWLASIHQKVMEMQVDNEKLKQWEELKSQEKDLQDEPNKV